MNADEESGLAAKATGGWLRWRGRRVEVPIVVVQDAARGGVKVPGSKAKKLGTFSGVFTRPRLHALLEGFEAE